MTIDAAVSSIEPIVRESSARLCTCEFFSHRHAMELHALGFVREFSPAESRYAQLCLSIAVTTMISQRICVRILWSRSGKEFPVEDRRGWELSLSDGGVRAFEAQWPVMHQRLSEAINRRSPLQNA